MDKRAFILISQAVRNRAIEAVRSAPEGYAVEVKEPNRNLSQNAAMWPILDAFSEQLQWPVNGQLVTLTAEEWKDILSAAFQQESTRLAMGLNGGVVMLGKRTSKFSKKEFGEWLEFLNAVAVERCVRIHDGEPS